MSTRTISKNAEFSSNNARLNSLLVSLQKKLHNFFVFERQGLLIGEVKDLVLDRNRQLNLVVSNQRFQQEQNYRVVLILSKLIQKIDAPNKHIYVDIAKSEIEFMPEYLGTQIQSETSQSTDVDTINTPAEISTTVDAELPEVVEQEIIRLLGERLIVDSSKRKVGEVIVRKQIETRMVQVPVRYEKLIVEQINPEHKQLAEIELGQGEEISGIDFSAEEIQHISRLDGGLTVSGEFDSPKIASLLLNAIAMEKNHGCKKIRIQISVENQERQKTYQEWFNRTSKNQATS